eukprot:763738-Hanusia_phi.AAC.3
MREGGDVKQPGQRGQSCGEHCHKYENGLQGTIFSERWVTRRGKSIEETGSSRDSSMGLEPCFCIQGKCMFPASPRQRGGRGGGPASWVGVVKVPIL